MRQSRNHLATHVVQDGPSSPRKATITRREFVQIAGTTFAAISVIPLLEACGPQSVIPSSMQFIQAVQNESNSISLIEGKRTLVRVFVPTSSDQPNITGSLTVSGITGSTTPLNPGITAVRNPSNFDLAQTLNFELPLQALSGSRVITVAVRVQGQSSVFATSTAHISFTHRPQQKLLPIFLSGGPTGLPEPSFSAYTDSLQGARTRYPIAENGFVLDPPLRMGIPGIVDLRGNLGWDLLIAQFTTMVFWFPATDVGGIRSGIVAPILDGAGNAIAPVGGISLPRILLTVPSLIVQAAGGPISSAFSQETFAHELGHAYGLFHSDCGNPAIPIDPRLPGRTDGIGVDVRTPTLIPIGSSEMMSYCGSPQWPSIATFNYLMQQSPI